MKKIFLDANIVLDFCIQNRQCHLQAQRIFSETLEGKYEMGISEDILTTIYYVGKKFLEKEILIDLFNAFEEELVIESFGKTVRKKALIYCQKNTSSDLEDVLQAFAAKENGYDILISNDVDFPSDIIPVMSSDEFLKK